MNIEIKTPKGDAFTRRCYCIAHTEPIVPKRFYDGCIALGDFDMTSPLHIAHIDTFWHDHYTVAFSAAASTNINKIIGLANPPCQVGICMHRKILIRKRIGTPSVYMPHVIEIDVAEMEKVSIEDTQPIDKYDFFVTYPLTLENGILGNYSTGHKIRDILDYVSLAVELNILTAVQANDFLQSKLLIPGGCEFGYYPGAWLFSVSSQLERLGREFLMRYTDRIATYDNFQRRALSFLTERLGSYFLLQELFQRYNGNIPVEVFGLMHCVGSYLPGVWANDGQLLKVG